VPRRETGGGGGLPRAGAGNDELRGGGVEKHAACHGVLALQCTFLILQSTMANHCRRRGADRGGFGGGGWGGRGGGHVHAMVNLVLMYSEARGC